MTSQPTTHHPQPSVLSELFHLFPAWLAFFWLITKAKWFWSNRTDMQFGWVVVMLTGYLIFEAWPTRPGLIFHRTKAFYCLLAVGSVMVLFSQVYEAALGLVPASVCLLAVGLFMVIAANFLFVFGSAGLRHFAMPVGFFLIALPLPSVIQANIVSFLQNLITSIDIEILRLIGIPAHRSGSLIYLQGGVVGVDEACSGIRSLQSSVMAALFIGYLTLKSGWLKLSLLVGGVGFAILGNLLRSLFLSYTAHTKGIASVKTVHDAAGWSILLFTAVCVVLLAWIMGKVELKSAAIRNQVTEGSRLANANSHQQHRGTTTP